MNEQKPLAVSYDADGYLDVHSYFHTVQGEGPFAGRSAFFIRLRGCNLQCPGCDTEYTDRSELFSPKQLVNAVADAGRTQGDLLVLTGGEPFRQNIVPFVNLALTMGFDVQVETNGMFFLPAFPFEDATVVVSPKTGKIHPDLAAMAAAFKYVLAADSVAEDGLPIQALDHPLGKYPHVARPPEGFLGPIYLQPMDAKDPAVNEANVQACVASVMKHRRYTLGIQMHKLTGLP